MKRLLLPLIMYGLTHSVVAAPLLFKAVKEITTDATVDVATFDATRYRQIRIGFKIERADLEKCHLITRKGSVTDYEKSSAQSRYDSAKRNQDLGLLSARSFALEEMNWNIFQSRLRDAREYPCPRVGIRGGEGDDLMPFLITGVFLLIDQPPSKIVMTGYGEAKYTVYIWGQ